MPAPTVRHTHHPHHSSPVRGPEWLYAAREAQFSIAEYVALLRSVAESLEGSDRLQLNEYVVDVPEVFEIDLRVERTPHGARALIIRAEWPEVNGDAVTVAPARNIRVAPAGVTSQGGGA